MEETPEEDKKHSTFINCTSNSIDGVSQDAHVVEIDVISDDSNDTMESTAEPSTRLELEEDNSNTTCRICRDETFSNDVISPCYCAGSLGRVHVKCLEEWLSKSNKNACEICQYKFHLKKQPRPFREWLCKHRSLRERRYIMGDCTCFCILTPLVATSTYMCGQGAWYYFANNDNWTAFGLLILSAFLWFVFVFWFVVTLTFHHRSWRDWRERNQLVKLVFSNSGLTKKRSYNSKSTSDSDESGLRLTSQTTVGNESCTQDDNDPTYVRLCPEENETNNIEFEEVSL